MHRDHDTLYLDYRNISKIEQHVMEEGMRHIDALTVEVVHLQGESLAGITRIKLRPELEEKYRELIVQLEQALKSS